MNRYSSERDTTADQKQPGTGMHLMLLAMCGHKTQRTGAKFRWNLAMLCAECNQKAKAK